MGWDAVASSSVFSVGLSDDESCERGRFSCDGSNLKVVASSSCDVDDESDSNETSRRGTTRWWS